MTRGAGAQMGRYENGVRQVREKGAESGSMTHKNVMMLLDDDDGNVTLAQSGRSDARAVSLRRRHADR